jgi:CheY-like chemotaxis protein
VHQLVVIEDDADIAQALGGMLALKGYAVECYANGSVALDQMRATALRPDAILLDLMMPELDGAAFLERAARDEHLRRVPVIVLTAQPVDRAHLQGNVVAMFQKPTSIDEILGVLRRVLAPA